MAKNLGAMVSREEILQAAKKIETESIKLIPATRFLVVVNDKTYPPKEIVRVAARTKGLNIDEYRLNGGESINKHLRRMGFEIQDKSNNIDDIIDPIYELIEKYKIYIQKSELKDEIYKWKLVEENKGKPNIEVDDFEKEITDLKPGNLIYAMAGAVIKHLAKEKPEELRNLFKVLFDETKELEDRVKFFNKESLDLYRSIEGKLGHHQDERTISAYLTYHDPQKYTFYKNSFYLKLCKLWNIAPELTGRKYVHYMDLVHQIIEDYIEEDHELIEIVKSYIPEYYDGTNHLLLAQDILYQMLDKEGNKNSDIINVLEAFIKQANTNNLKKQGYPIAYQGLKVKVSFGVGNAAKIPWIAFLKEPNQIMNGIYPVYLLYKEVNMLVLTYGLSEVNKSSLHWPSEAALKSIEQWYMEMFNKKPQRYGDSFVKSIYDLNEELDPNLIQEELDEIITLYKEMPFSENNNLKEKDILYNKDENLKKDTKKLALNQILFGPPGTGKTYTLKNKYFQKYTSKETSISHEKHFENIVKELSWWQTIGLALLELGKAKVGDIYNNRWVLQKAKLSESKNVRPTLWGQLQSHTIMECHFVNVKSRQTPYIFNKTEDSYWEILEEEVKEQSPELYEIKDRVENFVPDSNKEIKRYKFTTFHQSFSYEDFIEGIKPIMKDEHEETDELNYSIQAGVFKQLCTDAQNDPDNRYAIFIDEINRGNISNIFGELITLIEPDKRMGASQPMSAILPYSKKKFSVPNNVDIYGTMNTADRSVEALDTALRRRFTFKEIMPNSEIIKLEGKNNGIIKTENDIEIDLAKLLTTINERIEVLIDRDHTIGHSYFMDVNSTKQLKLVFKDKIIPLLQEYFYGDYGKIGLVLGNGFVEYQKKKENLFANFNYERKDELNNGFYTLKDIDNSFSIIYAVDQLMNNDENPEY